MPVKKRDSKRVQDITQKEGKNEKEKYGVWSDKKEESSEA